MQVKLKLGWVWMMALWLAIPGLLAGPLTLSKQSTRLYTAPDPEAQGGIQARLPDAASPILHVLALPEDNPLRVYAGAVSENGLQFSFQGLPVAKYDLVIVCADRFIEGLLLTLEADSLTSRDLEFIEAAIMKSVPFFDLKHIHRCAGSTGREGRARCVLQEVRTKPVFLHDTLPGAPGRTDIQIRSLKLAFLEDVGPVGWQLVRTREILRSEVAPQDVKGLLTHIFDPQLRGIRVTDAIKDLGTIHLLSSTPPERQTTPQSKVAALLDKTPPRNNHFE